MKFSSYLLFERWVIEKFCSKLVEQISNQWLGEEIRGHIVCLQIFQFNILAINVLLDEKVAHVDVLAIPRLAAASRLRHDNCRFIVLVDN